MSKLRRYYREGQIYFVTSVTYQRLPILMNNADLLQQAFENTKEKAEYNLIAYVFMPDHFHIMLDTQEHDLSDILRRIKQSFSMIYRKRAKVTGRVWQLRFWDHVIRDQIDMNNHIDYIHFNPVKHGLTETPFDYPHSSIHDYAADEFYKPDWGHIGNLKLGRE